MIVFLLLIGLNEDLTGISNGKVIFNYLSILRSGIGNLAGDKHIFVKENNVYLP
jgi:hypothetical protein